jgi:dissimilatory sulfite reductase (desulfoviridin) alpha/beta subunit
MKGGIITERDYQHCLVRLRIPAGVITPEQLSGIAKIAKRYRIDEVHLTTRQTMELRHVDPGVLPRLLPALEKNLTPLGAEREEVVNITACPGLDTCRWANIRTTDLAKKIDEKYFGRPLPVKVRIAISACPNGCTSERLSEIGITGIRTPIRNDGLCTGCGTCAHTCKECAIQMVNGRLRLDEETCMKCGMCVDSCPFGIILSENPMYRITIGGRRGRHPLVGRDLVTVTGEDAVIMVVDKIIDWIYRYAYTGRLLTDQLDELEYDLFREKILDEFEEISAREDI